MFKTCPVCLKDVLFIGWLREMNLALHTLLVPNLFGIISAYPCPVAPF